MLGLRFDGAGHYMIRLSCIHILHFNLTFSIIFKILRAIRGNLLNGEKLSYTYLQHSLALELVISEAKLKKRTFCSEKILAIK